MSLTTHSRIYYGLSVDETNFQIDFDEGGGELTADLQIGDYSLTELVDEVERALNEAGALTYTTTLDRSTRKITISAGANFDLLISSGSHAGTSAFDLIGFTGADLTGDDSYESNLGAGSEYVTQFIPQSYVSSDDLRGFAYATVNKSASGRVEMVTFGEEQFVEFNLKYITNIVQGTGTPIRTNISGKSDALALIRNLISKAPIEFMPDEDDYGDYETLQLESTPEDQNGTKYKLKELLGQNLPGYFETGVLKFRVID